MTELLANEAGEFPLFSVRDIHKSFGTNAVLRGINLDVYPAEVLALVGGNGAGKSTLVKSVMGIYRPDAGEIFIAGEPLEFSSPKMSLGRGVYLVPQEPMLFPNMTVEQNVLMGFRGKKAVLREKLSALLAQLGWNMDLARSARTLSIAEQQLVEILRGLLREARVLILDEPTSALTFDEVTSLFGIIESLKQKRISIIYITHRLNEVFQIATHAAIMRDGVITLHGRAEEFTREMLVRGLLPEDFTARENGAGEGRRELDYGSMNPVFELQNYSGYGFADISFKIYPGEVLGLCGVVGAGRTELAMTIFGRDTVKSGKAFLDGRDITGMNTRAIIKKGINYVPEDRFQNGIFRTASIAGNLSSAFLNFTSGLFLNFRVESGLASKYIGDFRIKAAGQKDEIGSLSGGNQQKVVIGRSLSTEPRLVIMDEPTRGIDAGARGDIYAIISELKAKNVAVLLISSDMEEIVELSDRALAMFQGRISREFRGAEITQDNLMSASFGVAGEAV
ncbi:MAG: sugar ABC transporter ATP-binding protein [Spirochaetaceae bacterium]|jgi:AI-2 transport system ATP-binding protein|nr:sugar ABC transporter ATP-binding protein [Spirochaetaceae bacterium]